MVEAAIALPMFFAVLLSSVRILMVCYQGIQLQNEVSETTRMTFTLDNAARAGDSWQTYFESTLSNRISRTGLSGLGKRDEHGKLQLAKDKLKPKRKKEQPSQGGGNTPFEDGWPGPMSQPGEAFSIEITSEEPLLPASLAGINSPTITLKARAVAIINRLEGE